MERFIEDPANNLDIAETFRKEEWRGLARHYGIAVAGSARKDEIKEAVLDFLGEAGMLGEDTNEEEK